MESHAEKVVDAALLVSVCFAKIKVLKRDIAVYMFNHGKRMRRLILVRQKSAEFGGVTSLSASAGITVRHKFGYKGIYLSHVLED